MLKGTDLKVGQRIKLHICNGEDSTLTATGTIIPRKSLGSPLFMADEEYVEWLHNGANQATDYYENRYWFMTSSYIEGIDFTLLKESTVGLSELI